MISIAANTTVAALRAGHIATFEAEGTSIHATVAMIRPIAGSLAEITTEDGLTYRTYANAKATVTALYAGVPTRPLRDRLTDGLVRTLARNTRAFYAA